MAIVRHGAVLALSTIVVAVLSAAPAHADTAETFAGTGTARALHLNVLGQDLTLGATTADAASTLSAAANAAGQLLQTGYPAKAAVNADNSSVVDPKSGSPLCQGLDLPDPLKNVLDAGIACSLAKADIKAGAPHALGQASVAELGVSANALLQPITDKIPLDQTLDAVKQDLGPVIDAVNQATGGQVDVNKDLKTVTDLLHALTTQQTLAVKLGDSSSEQTTVANSLTSTSSAQGATIEILPVSALGGTPLATITVGAAKATAIYDRTQGKSSAIFDPALVSVHFASALGLPDVKVAPGQTITLLAGTPLESTITVADGSQETGATSAKAVADGVSLHLLKGINLPTGTSGLSTAATGPGAVVLELAHAEASVNGTPKVVSPPPNVAPPAPEVKSLAFTGTSPWLPLGGMALLGAAWGTRRLRRRVAA